MGKSGQREEQAKREAAALLGWYGGRARMAGMSRAERRAMQRQGGVMRARRLSRARKREIAAMGARARWAKVGGAGR
jgi:hypothetical protein